MKKLNRKKLKREIDWILDENIDEPYDKDIMTVVKMKKPNRKRHFKWTEWKDKSDKWKEEHMR